MDQARQLEEVKGLDGPTTGGLSGVHVNSVAKNNRTPVSDPSILSPVEAAIASQDKNLTREFSVVLHAYDRGGRSFKLYMKMYILMESYVKELQLTTLLSGTIDEDIVKVFRGPFMKLVTMLTEVSYNYWEMLKLQPDCREFPEVAKLRRYKSEFRTEWRSLYKNRRKLNAKTEGNGFEAGSENSKGRDKSSSI